MITRRGVLSIVLTRQNALCLRRRALHLAARFLPLGFGGGCGLVGALEKLRAVREQFCGRIRAGCGLRRRWLAQLLNVERNEVKRQQPLPLVRHLVAEQCRARIHHFRRLVGSVERLKVIAGAVQVEIGIRKILSPGVECIERRAEITRLDIVRSFRGDPRFARLISRFAPRARRMLVRSTRATRTLRQ